MNFYLVEPSAKYIKQENIIDHVANCARVCYDSEHGDNEKLYKSLITRGHLSTLRHATYYYKFNLNDLPSGLTSMGFLNPFVNAHHVDNHIIVVTNGQFIHDRKLDHWESYRISEEEVPFKYRRFTFILETSIAVSRELNRVSPNNITERSTRYVDYSKSKYKGIPINIPYWFEGINKEAENLYLESMNIITEKYLKLRDSKLSPEQARGLLPLDTHTKVIYTYTYNEWIEIFRKRIYHETGKAHPDAVLICKKVEDKLKKLENEYEKR